MMIRIGSLLAKSNGAGGGAFTPTDLFGATYAGDWFDFSDLTRMFTDLGTTAVASNNDPVRRVGGQRGAVTIDAPSDAARPLYQASNATLLGDGVNDVLMGDVSITGYPLTLAVLLDAAVESAPYGIAAVSSGPGAYRGIRADSTFSRGSDRESLNLNTSPGLTRTLAAGFKWAYLVCASAGNIRFFYVEGVESTLSTAHTHASAAKLVLFAGAQSVGVASQFAGGQVRALLAINKVLTTGDIASLESWKDGL